MTECGSNGVGEHSQPTLPNSHTPTLPQTARGPSSIWSGPCGASRCWNAPACSTSGPGLYEVTPDAHPVIDGLTDPAGFCVVAGFSGHGFMHSPIAGLLVAEMILDGHARSLDVHQLRFSRFAEGDLVREHNVV